MGGNGDITQPPNFGLVVMNGKTINNTIFVNKVTNIHLMAHYSGYGVNIYCDGSLMNSLTYSNTVCNIFCYFNDVCIG